ncbi:MAG: FlgD immunoglobulin-like domain containing protein [bacterium]|nr:FlgD immunoglobulin-like domain containing protein [bacterium]
MARPGPGWAQEWLLFSKANSGLPDDYVAVVTFDQKQRAWIGTGSGFVVFDGRSWTHGKELGFPAGNGEAFVADLCFDDGGRLWVASYGLLNYDGTTWEWYLPNVTPLPHSFVNCLATFGGAGFGGIVWVGTNGGLVKVQRGGWTVYTTTNSELPADWIACLKIAPDRMLWAGVFGHGVVRHEGGNRFTQYNLPSSGPYAYNSAWDMAFDQEGHLWVATSEGLVHFDGSAWRIFTVYNSPIPDNCLYCVEVDAEGSVWMGTDAAGLVRRKGEQWEVWSASNSPLPENTVVSLAIDRWGNKWLGTGSKGLAIFREGGVILGAGAQESPAPPQQFVLAQNYPNPFTTSTLVRFTLERMAKANLTVYDAQGHAVVTLFSGTISAGSHTVSWDGRNRLGEALPSGLYTCQLTAEGQAARVKMVLVR